MEKILITGTGMLASALDRRAQALGFQTMLVSRAQMDVTDATAVEQVICASKASYVFHTAAMTKVNQCEEHPSLAHGVNALGTKNVVDATSKLSARLVYLSTDYVFDGTRESGWFENDTPNPLNEYGKSKLAGEQFVQDYKNGHIVRTSGVFGTRSDGIMERNFVRAIATKLQSGSADIPVVDDQFTALTYAKHLAEMILSLLQSGLPDIVHLTSSGEYSWFGWARAITGTLGTGALRIQPVPSKQVDTGTVRPGHSVLKSLCRETSAFKLAFPALEGLREYLNEIGFNGQSKDLSAN